MKKFPGFPKEPATIVNGVSYKGNPEGVIRDLVKQIQELREKKQNYYCVIPWKLLTDKNISSTAKLLYGEISALANREGYCWATNKHFAETFGIKNSTTISALIHKLEAVNYIYVEIKEGYKRRIWLYPPVLKEGGVMKKNKGDYEKSLGGVMKNHNKDNIILDNNKENIHEQKDVRVRTYKRLDPEKQTVIHRLCYHLEDSLDTKVVNWGKQGSAIKRMLRADYKEEEIKRTITYMAKDDPFFADKGFDMITVSNAISRYKGKASAIRRNHV